MHFLIDPDGAVLRFIHKLVHSVWLNLLWAICCLPIVTIGPATTALFYCCQKLVSDEEGYLTQTFFKSFSQNFKQATFIGITLTALGGVLAIDAYALYHLHFTSVFWTLITAIFIVAVIAYLLISTWIYPLLAHFENTTFAMFKNALLLSMRYLICSAFMLLIYFFMLVMIVRIFTPAIIFGFGTCALLCSMLLKKIFLQLEVIEVNLENE